MKSSKRGNEREVKNERKTKKKKERNRIERDGE